MADTKKQAKKRQPKSANAPDPTPDGNGAAVEADDVDEFRLDIGSFDLAERRRIQARFDTDFEDLVLYVEDKLNRFKARDIPEALGVEWREPPVAIVDANGVKVFADEIVIAMIAEQKRRTDPDFDEASLADVTNVEILEMSRRPPKARTSKDGSKTKT